MQSLSSSHDQNDDEITMWHIQIDFIIAKWSCPSGIDIMIDAFYVLWFRQLTIKMFPSSEWLHLRYLD